MEVGRAGKPRRKSKYNNPLKRKIFIVCMLAIPMANFCVFTIYANLGGVFISLFQFDGTREYFVGFENYAKFFRLFWVNSYDQVILTSFAWLPVVLLVMFPLAILFSFFFYKKVPFAKISIILLFLPNIIPAAVMSEFYRRMWDAGGGVVQPGLFTQMFAFVTGREINWLVSYDYVHWALYIYTVWFGFGVNSLLIWGAMSRIPQELVEAAEIDGANLFVEFTRITVPVIWPTLSIVILMYLMTPFTLFSQPLMLAQNGQYGTTTLALLAMNEIRRPDPYYASAIYIMIACVSIPLSILARKGMSKMFTVVEI